MVVGKLLTIKMLVNMFYLNEKFVLKEVQDGLLLINKENNEIYQLTSISKIIFEKLILNESIENIENFILENFDADEKEVKTDILELLTDLKNQKILVEK